MFILEREEQFFELLRSWAWRYKRRQLIKVPLPDSPELYDLAIRLCRCSGPYVQEAWAVTRQPEGLFLWLEAPGPNSRNFITALEEKLPGTIDITSCWNWDTPCTADGTNWLYPLTICTPHSTEKKQTKSGRPPKKISYHSDSSGIWKFGQPFFTRFESPLSLLVKSDHPAHRILIRKQIARLFDWKKTWLIDLGESPLCLTIGTDAREQEEYIHRFCRKITDFSKNTPVVVLCDTVSSSHESAIIHQLLYHLADHAPLLLCLEPSEHIRFCWALTDEVSELFPIPSEKHNGGKKIDPTILERIVRLMDIIPDRLSMDQLKKWFARKEKPQVDSCLDQGYLIEKSGRIMISDILSQHRLTASIPACPCAEDEEEILHQALAFLNSPLSEFKLLLLQEDLPSLEKLCRSSGFLRLMHQQSRQLSRLLEHTEKRWGHQTKTALIVSELSLSLFLLPQTERCLNLIGTSGTENEKAREYRMILDDLRDFSLDRLLSRIGSDGEQHDADHPRIQPAELEERGYLSLAIIMEIEESISSGSDKLTRKMNEFLFRGKCLDNPDLHIWCNTAWAHWQMRNGSPALARSLLQDCQRIQSPHLLSCQASIEICEILLGHWNWPAQAWPGRLPCGDLPPDRRCWDYLHLMLQHRFGEADIKYQSLFPFSETGKDSQQKHCAGLGPENMAAFGSGKPDRLPPWMEFVQMAVLPFAKQAGRDSVSLPALPPAWVGRERNYYYYEAHYLRFHDPRTPLPNQGEEKDIFLDTCAYFTRRGRRMSPQMEAIGNRLAGIALTESRLRIPRDESPSSLNSVTPEDAPSPLDAIIGRSPVIIELKMQIQKVSRVDFTVTILGESGTGKEIIARTIHQLSPRREAPFITFNCAALPETMLEAELFGFQKGAFTDARETRVGLIEAAEGGSLFLDEIGEMPLLLQAKLLRFLQDRQLRRLGENRLRPVNCRIICATHRDLRSMVRENSFREDLFYRIIELTVQVPPLRERKEDLPLLLDHFIEKYRFPDLSDTERLWLGLKWMSRNWPGNVRELESRIKELITYYPHHPDMEEEQQAVRFNEGTLHSSKKQFERICILRALERNGWNRSQSAEDLGISRIALFKLMRKHRLMETR